MPSLEENPTQEMTPVAADTPPLFEFALVSGLAPGSGGNGRNVRPNRVFRMDQVGLVFEGEPGEAEIRNLLGGLKCVRDGYHLILADVITKSRQRLGEERTSELLEQLEFPAIDVEKAIAIAALAREWRHPALTTEHYFVVQRAEALDPLGRELWLNKAREQRLTALELRRSIEAGKIVRLTDGEAAAGRHSGIATIESIRFSFDRWRQHNERDILAAAPETRRKFLDEVAPVVDLATRVRASLEGSAS